MCGICGMAGHVDPKLLAQMTQMIHHRGPDDGGTYLDPSGYVGLGNRRLSIIDLSPAGHMPMSNMDETLWITYNGEVYNFPALRQEMESKGYPFRSRTDTEVILALYQEYGVQAFARLNGMFALAIWDTRTQELTLARDRFGVKPLYYAAVPGGLLFGSEVKSLLLDPRLRREINLEALNDYLAFLWVPGPQTLFKGVYKLPPAHYLRWKAQEFSVAPYWTIFWEEEHRSKADIASELREVLVRAVERHLISDVPLGLFLSGGLDSTTLLAIMSQLTKDPVEAYTIAFQGEDARLEQSAGEDDQYADLAAAHFGANLHRITVAPDIASLLPRVIWHLDEPVADPAAINTLLISEAARPQVTVLLSGQGADEVFGGYRVHLANRFQKPLKWIPAWMREQVLVPGLNVLPHLAGRIPGLHPGLLLAFHRYFSRIIPQVDLPARELYLYNRSYYSQAELNALYTAGVSAGMNGANKDKSHQAYFQEAAYAHFTNQMLHVDLKTFLPELNLAYGDKLSMAASIETRVPFLDYELVEFMSRVPADLKIRGLTGKYILREAVKDLVPGAIIRRRKAGFGAPIRKWLQADLGEMMDDLLSEATLQQRGFFKPSAIRGMISQHRDGKADYTYQIWALLTLELWQRIFIDQSIRV